MAKDRKSRLPARRCPKNLPHHQIQSRDHRHYPRPTASSRRRWRTASVRRSRTSCPDHCPGRPGCRRPESLRVGARGPLVVDDFHFREKIFHFDHERIPERVVHARGYGAHGFFETYESADVYPGRCLSARRRERRRCSCGSRRLPATRALPISPATSAALPSRCTPRKATGILSATTFLYSSSRTPSSFPTSFTP
jgi:hypothetical protein